MSANYRTHLIDKQAHALGTKYYQMVNTPATPAPARQVIYRTRSTSKSTITYEIQGYGREIKLEVAEGSLMADALASIMRSPNTNALDLLVSTLEAQQS